MNVRSPEFRVILNKLSMQELNVIIENINRDNIGLVTRNEVYVRRPVVTQRRRRNFDFVCINRSPEAREENSEVLRMISALLIMCVLFLILMLMLR